MIRRRYIDGPDGQIHVAEAGAGPTILLLHQTPRSWDEFREVIEQLRDRFRLVAMDLPGMGSSDQHPDGGSIEHYTDAAIMVIEDLDRGPVVVCGHHTGGVVAIDVAARRADLVSALVLSSTPWVDEEARQVRATKNPIDTVTRRLDGSHLLSLWEQRAPFYGDDLGHLDRFVTDAMRSDDPATGHRAVGHYEMERAVGSIGCPVTIVEHSSDPFASVHTGEFVERFPAASVARIPDGGVALEATAAQFAEHLATAADPG